MIVPRRKFCIPFIGLQRRLRHTVLSCVGVCHEFDEGSHHHKRNYNY
jgi:hypothetical protein